ncbi:DUF2254 domain-containing protein [Mycolicibacterium palauense]|uniref:DUF2254 domain-containing protein n=1 Tax=Mycolicibacterium palauense TaxID=2034511 RepID=UPI000BFEEB2C|nr:DUF2254 domain-containing protein [Mycolicibacterium palauense]
MGVRSALASRSTLVLDVVRTRLWPVPAMGIAIAICAGVALPELDRALDDRLTATASDYTGSDYLFGGGADAARDVLTAVSSSLITVTSLTFSLTLVTLQLASGQFSPRLLRTFARDRFVQWTLALFLATFVYALTVLRSVRNDGPGQREFVPKVSVTVAYLLAVLCVITLVLFLAHLVRQIRVETLLDTVRHDAMTAAGSLLRDSDDEADGDGGRGSGGGALPVAPPEALDVCAPATGFLAHVDGQGVLAAAAEAHAVVVVHRMPGEWIVEGTPIARAWSARGTGRLDSEAAQRLVRCVADAVYTADERTPIQDVGYGLRQLTDVAVKSLSPGINDPTTAVHVLGHSAVVLCELSDHRLGPVRLTADETRDTLVVLSRPAMADLLDLAVSAPRRYGSSDPDLLAAILALLRDLAWRCHRDGDREAVAAQLERVRRTAGQQDFDDSERAGLRALGRAVEEALQGRWAVGPNGDSNGEPER